MASIVDDEPGPSTAPSPPSLIPVDRDYFMDAFFVTFEVDGCIFRVPSHQFFKESPDFVEIYKLSTHVTDNDEPIKLEKVSQEDFRSLLKVLYPLSVSLQLSLSKHEWISVLTLSSEWRFLRLREMARGELQRLGSLTSVEKICLGRALRIFSWVVEGFEELVQRGDTITDDEAIDIDSDYVTTVYKLFRIRELRISGKLPSAGQEIEQVFKEELDRLWHEENEFNLIDQEEEIRRKQERVDMRVMEEIERREAEERRRQECEDEERRMKEREDEERRMKEREEEERARREEEEEARKSSLSHQLKKKKKGSSMRPNEASSSGGGQSRFF